MNTIKTATRSGEPVFVTQDGTQTPYVPKTITTARTAFTASLHLMFQHVADFHILILTILSEKVGHSVEEMFEHIYADPRYKSMLTNPLIADMGYFEEADLTSAMENLSLAPKPEPEPVQPKKVVKKRVLKKTVVDADDS